MARDRLWDPALPLTERITDLYLITLFFIFPLFPGFHGYSDITAAKFFMLTGATALWLALLCVAGLAGKAAPLRRSPARSLLLGYLAVCLLSWLCSPDRAASLVGAGRYDGLLTALLYGLIFLGVSAFTVPKRLHLVALALAISLCQLLALLQLAGYNPLHLFPEELTYYDAGIRYSGTYLGTIGNTNILDAVLCLSLPAFFTLYLTEGRRLYLIPAAVSVPVLLCAGGDGGKLALALTGLAALPLLITDLPRFGRLLRGAGILLAAGSPVRPWLLLCGAALFGLSLLPLWKKVVSRPDRFRKIWLVLALAIIAAILLLALLTPAESGFYFELGQVLRGNADDGFGSTRIRIWRECLALIPERPLLGGGPGTLALRLDILFSRAVPETGGTLKSVVDNAHNVYLAALVNTGAVGLAALLLFGGTVALRAARQLADPLRCALALGALCFAIHEFFGLGLCLSEPLQWAVMGLLCAAGADTGPAIFPAEQKEDAKIEAQ